MSHFSLLLSSHFASIFTLIIQTIRPYTATSDIAQRQFNHKVPLLSNSSCITAVDTNEQTVELI